MDDTTLTQLLGCDPGPLRRAEADDALLRLEKLLTRALRDVVACDPSGTVVLQPPLAEVDDGPADLVRASFRLLWRRVEVDVFVAVPTDGPVRFEPGSPATANGELAAWLHDELGPAVEQRLCESERLAADAIASSRAADALRWFRQARKTAQLAQQNAALVLAHQARGEGRLQLAATIESLADDWSGTVGELLDSAEQVTVGHE